ncbi:MAG: hypothetical protein FJ304_20855, partial [Planctomycetes bacterium]|nr:hypothetical protein [Planctomycetota bacterium]
MNTDRPQLIEVLSATGRVGAVIVAGGLASARGSGADAGESVRAVAVAKAVAPTLKRAAELLAAIQAATRTEQECGRRAGEVERARKLAAASLFGPALDNKLRELAGEDSAIVEDRIGAKFAREGAMEELQKLRGEAVRGPAEAVGRAAAGRLRA